MEIGNMIRQARLEKGLSQKKLGQLVGVCTSTINKYESGNIVNIKRSTLQKLAEVLDLRGSDFIVAADPKGAASLSAKVLTDSNLRELVELYSALGAENQKAVLELIRRMEK